MEKINNIRDAKGRFVKGIIIPKDWKDKMSIRMQGNKYNLGRKHTQEWKDLISSKSLGKKRGTMSIELKTKLSKIRLERIANGKIKTWNKGLKGKEFKKHYKYNFQHLRNRQGKTWEEIYGKEKAQEILNKKIGKKQSPETIEKRVSKMRGEKSHLWMGGKTKEKYDFKTYNQKFKKAIRKRDNYICMNCGIHREKLTRNLSVHHIDYNKDLTIKENCITLCNSCHTMTNQNREYWIKLFQEKLSKLYNYKYSSD